MKKVNLNIRPLIHEIAFGRMKLLAYNEQMDVFKKNQIDSTKALLKRHKGKQLLRLIQIKYGVNLSTAKQAVLNEERR
ncbi:MAG: hypothetical protein KAS32_14280 [Candidatus Peribacteraceae bacterium]|nr:hypothetical protein [Candidatus Peribacteraceae bacterium]